MKFMTAAVVLSGMEIIFFIEAHTMLCFVLLVNSGDNTPMIQQLQKSAYTHSRTSASYAALQAGDPA